MTEPREFMAIRPVWALNDDQLARLRAEAEELKTFLQEEEREGRDLQPPYMNAKARLATVEREIAMAESARRGGLIAEQKRPQPQLIVDVDSCGRMRRQTRRRVLRVPEHMEAERCTIEKLMAVQARSPRFMPIRKAGR